ncbi:MAG: hypothetical protein C0482_04870 [Gordonia sp.]|nr:hypothetical protein [Gordonia sp. (in: high G+C Gram-positive bacteria)]
MGAIAGVWVVLLYVPVLWAFALMIACLCCIGAGAWGYRTFDGDPVAVGVVATGIVVAALSVAR